MRELRRSAAVLAAAFTSLACGEPESTVTGAQMAAPESESHVTAGNGAPRIEELTLSPPAPKPGETIVAQVRTSDPDGDVVLLSYVWRVDGQVRPVQGPDLLVSGERGAPIELEVTPRDAHASGAPRTASAQVGNQPPSILRVTFNEVSGGKDLVADPELSDPDGDEVEVSYGWYVNDTLVENVSGPLLAWSTFSSGDRIRVAVTASDGAGGTDSLESEPVEVGSAAPRITSTVPPDFDADGVFRYQIAAEHADGSVLRYRLLLGPKGMELDPFDGRLVWTPTEAQEGEHSVKVEVRDARGATAVQSFALKVEFSTEEVPAAPAS